MGMFDNITVNLKMFGLAENYTLEVFQTKDFDSFMEDYFIDVDKNLRKTTFDKKLIPLEERMFPDMPEIGKYRSIPNGSIAVDYSGVLNFYTYKKEVWIEINAIFVNGVMTEFEIIKDN